MDAMQKRLILRIFGFTLIACTLLLLTASRLPSQSIEETPLKVSSQKLEKHNAPRMLKLYGKVTALKPADIESTVLSKVTAIYFKEGDQVKQGDLLIELDHTSLKIKKAALTAESEKIQSSITQLESSFKHEQALKKYELKLLNQAKDELKSYQQLNQSYQSEQKLRAYKEVVITREKQYTVHMRNVESLIHDIQQQQANLDVTTANLLQVIHDIDSNTIKAPFDGTIEQVFVSVGQVTQVGQPIINIQNPQLIFINVFMPAQYLNHLEPGKSQAMLNNSHETLMLNRISHNVDEGTAHIDAAYYFTQQTPLLAIGSIVSLYADINLDQETYLIPETSIYQDRFIYIIDNHSLIEKNIQPQGIRYIQDTPYYLISSEEDLTSKDVLTTRITQPRNGMRVNHVPETQ